MYRSIQLLLSIFDSLEKDEGMEEVRYTRKFYDKSLRSLKHLAFFLSVTLFPLFSVITKMVTLKLCECRYPSRLVMEAIELMLLICFWYRREVRDNSV